MKGGEEGQKEERWNVGREREEEGGGPKAGRRKKAGGREDRNL